MRIEVDAKFGGALDYVFAVDAAGECFVFHFLSHAGDFDVGDGLRGLDQGTGGEEAREFVAGEESFI